MSVLLAIVIAIALTSATTGVHIGAQLNRRAHRADRIYREARTRAELGLRK